jgi:hypothetical protein
MDLKSRFEEVTKVSCSPFALRRRRPCSRSIDGFWDVWSQDPMLTACACSAIYASPSCPGSTRVSSVLRPSSPFILACFRIFAFPPIYFNHLTRPKPPAPKLSKSLSNASTKFSSRTTPTSKRSRFPSPRAPPSPTPSIDRKRLPLHQLLHLTL